LLALVVAFARPRLGCVAASALVVSALSACVGGPSVSEPLGRDTPLGAEWRSLGIGYLRGAPSAGMCTAFKLAEGVAVTDGHCAAVLAQADLTAVAFFLPGENLPVPLRFAVTRPSVRELPRVVREPSSGENINDILLIKHRPPERDAPVAAIDWKWREPDAGDEPVALTAASIDDPASKAVQTFACFALDDDAREALVAKNNGGAIAGSGAAVLGCQTAPRTAGGPVYRVEGEGETRIVKLVGIVTGTFDASTVGAREGTKPAAKVVIGRYPRFVRFRPLATTLDAYRAFVVNKQGKDDDDEDDDKPLPGSDTTPGD
jgi:hypothetical protein